MSSPFSIAPATASSSPAPLLARIHLSALERNLGALRRMLPTSADVIAVVKADGYGHGSPAIADALSRLGIRRFGVATVREGLALREAGIDGTILVMGGIFPSQCRDLVEADLTPVLSDADVAHALCPHVAERQRPYPVHVKLDTGMRRLGFSPHAAQTFLQSPLFARALSCRGLMTHLADAENTDPAFTLRQLDRFADAVRNLRAAGVPIPRLHAANTAGALWHPHSRLDMVRPGLLLYGYAPTPHRPAPVSLDPVMTLTTKVAHVKTVAKDEPVSYGGRYRTTRESRLAVLPIGYTHGYNRRLSNAGAVIIHDRRRPVVGRICMDMTVVDVTDAPGVKPGDDVIVLGRSPTQSITAYDLAEWQDSIPYEVLCNLGSNAQRVYEPLTDRGAEHDVAAAGDDAGRRAGRA